MGPYDYPGGYPIHHEELNRAFAALGGEFKEGTRLVGLNSRMQAIFMHPTHCIMRSCSCMHLRRSTTSTGTRSRPAPLSWDIIQP